MVTDNRQIAFENELLLLQAINRCAYMRTIEVARLAWPKSSTASGQRMAQRTLSRLLSKGELLHAKGANGTVLYGLSEPGARRLTNELGGEAKSAKDAIRSLANFRHRIMCNRAFVDAEIAERRPNWTEHEILSQRGAIFQWLGKRPDLLVWSEAGGASGWWWIEVEHSRRNGKEMLRLSAWLRDAIYRQCYRGTYPLRMGSEDSTPLLGVVLLFETRDELEKLRQQTKSEIEKWIQPTDRTSYSNQVAVGNNASIFMCDFVHFVLLDDFAAWLHLSEPSLYFPSAA